MFTAPARSTRALALVLGKDYRRVHEDVEALVNAGLLDRDERDYGWSMAAFAGRRESRRSV